MLMMLMGICNIYSYIFARENVAGSINSYLLSVTQNPQVMVAIIIIIMLVIGCFMETLAATVVLLPVFYPIVMKMGVDPLMFGVLFSIATVVGGLTPPVGLYLFLSMDIAKAPFREAVRYTGVVVLIVLLAMLLIFAFPKAMFFVPNLIMK
jgi:C4-dicarboxylate transporter DctM subunit